MENFKGRHGVDKNKQMIVAVVVTFNRLALLQRNVACLRANQPIDKILVIDNGSTDGTSAWLDTASDDHLQVIHQDNVGGSGGFYCGIEEACRMGADWVWCMDDDVFPRLDCLEQLLTYADDKQIGLLAPRRLMEGRVYTNDFTGYDLVHPFKSLYVDKLRKRKQPVDSPVYIAGTAFEGPLIRVEAIQKIGLPKKELFIFCDDTDYCLRLWKAGYKMLYVPTAFMDKQKFFSQDTWAERNRKKKWKRFYQVRNTTYLNHHYGENWAVRYLRGLLCVLGYIFIAIVTAPFSKAYTFSDIPKLWSAYKDGLRENLGKYA